MQELFQWELPAPAFLRAQCQQLLENFIYILIQSFVSPLIIGSLLFGEARCVIAITPRSTPLAAAWWTIQQKRRGK